jgi:hypothetical protein
MSKVLENDLIFRIIQSHHSQTGNVDLQAIKEKIREKKIEMSDEIILKRIHEFQNSKYYRFG